MIEWQIFTIFRNWSFIFISIFHPKYTKKRCPFQPLMTMLNNDWFKDTLENSIQVHLLFLWLLPDGKVLWGVLLVMGWLPIKGCEGRPGPSGARWGEWRDPPATGRHAPTGSYRGQYSISFYRVSHNTGHLKNLSQALYKYELGTWIFSKCLIL